VQLDGLVVSKIIKHSSEATPGSALGLLIGLDFDGTLEISNSFPLPHAMDEEDKTTKALARYQASMLRSLKEVQADDSIVGFYQSNTLGAFYKQSLVDLQAVHQEKLRHGGVVVVHDVSQANKGNAAFRAFKLSKEFLGAYKTGRFNTQSLVDHQLTFSSIVEEIPLRIRTNPLLGAFLTSLSASPSPESVGSASASPLVDPISTPKPALQPSFSALNLAPQSLTQNLTRVLDSLDDYKTEEGNLAYLSRQIAREKARAEAHVAKRKEENAVRVAQGLAPLPEDDVSRLFKIPAEPSRLELMLLLGQIDAYSKSLAEASSTSMAKMYAANASSSI